MSAFMVFQSKISPSLKPSNFTSQNLLKAPIFSVKPKSLYLHVNLPSSLKVIQTTVKLTLSASAADPIFSEEETPTEPYFTNSWWGTGFYSWRLGVVVKPMEKPRIALKFIWMHKAIDVAPCYFWSKEDAWAWDQLKMLLESKPRISRKQMHILLNHATDIINLWKESSCNS
ncbi:hypothetical protein P3X46_029534 [Hevea brasiliensis]|uniref:Uncharacterized protein n=1 Tax=Hevea brasiliensis TaxID=3981 RepID=A0ABQ9KVG4_HEVBR|nr:hypothetical protein P3X46_029534 [Hevea brasiliensis]